MNHRAVGWLVGRVCLLLCGVLVVPGLVAAYYRERAVLEGCLFAAATSALVGLCLTILCRAARTSRTGRPDYFRREGLAAVGLAWVAAATLGALPFLFSGTMTSFADAFFESSSGFTTTGSTVLSPAAIDALPRGIVFWRAFSHWLGGIGIIIVFVLLFPAGGRSLFRSEVSGISREAARARVRDSARSLLRIYLVLTAVHAALLWMLQRDLFDAVVHAFSTLATGGFSSHGNSVLFYGSWKVELVIVLFMFLAGIDFGVYDVFQRQGPAAGVRALLRSSEVRAYAALMVAATLLIALQLWLWGGSNGVADAALPDYSRLSRCLRDSLFSVTSMQSCTGYATADFDRWPDACRLILVGLMAIGACSGSTGGGIKVVRILVLGRAALQGIARFARPRAIQTVRIDGFALDDGTVGAVLAYVGLWIMVAVASTVVCLELGIPDRPGFEDQHILTASTAVIASLSNCGPGLAAVGPWQNFGFLPSLTKLLLGFLMLLGRLEFTALVVLFLPRFWRG
jgi:trk system potassium uptake protein TrkH